MTLHPGDQEAIDLAVAKRRSEPYPPLSERQVMILESIFKRKPTTLAEKDRGS